MFFRGSQLANFLFPFSPGSRKRALSGKHLLNLNHLNSAVIFKEIFLAYLNAALLEVYMCMDECGDAGVPGPKT